MTTHRFDTAVIGAGPAGSRAAALVAREGFSVLLLEKRERVGYPVRCAEAVGPRSDVERFLRLDDSLISSQVNGVKVVAPDGKVFELEMPGIGFVVDRELFDGRLADEARSSGAQLRTGHQAVALLSENGRCSGLVAREMGTSTEYEVKASIVIGADGVEALSPRWAGLKDGFLPEEIFSCAQELVEGIDTKGSFIEFHLGRRFAPGGYAWVFPKGSGKANVGVGINPTVAGGMHALDYMNRFMEHRCPGGNRRRLVIGGCSVARGLPALATNGYVVVGEAACQNNPFSGGGIINALEGADMAAEAVIRSLREGDCSAGKLLAYSRDWKGSAGKTNERFFHAARVFYSLTDDELNRILRELRDVPGIFDSSGIKPDRMLRAMISSKPSIVFQVLRSLITSRIKDIVQKRRVRARSGTLRGR